MFQAHGVENFIELGWRKLDTKENRVVYVGDQGNMYDKVGSHPLSREGECQEGIPVVFVPRRSFLCEKF